MNNNIVDLLLVEDDEAHAELIRRAFESQADRVRFRVAHTIREARTYIVSSTPDLIIADLRLPDGQGIDLLASEGHDSSYPVVIMTSHGDEQIAVEAIKAGALDYVVKSEHILTEMPHIAERALREWSHLTERQRAENALRESEERYALAARGANDGLWDWDLRTNTVYFSPRWKSMLGWEEHAIDNTLDEWFRRIHPEEIERVKTEMTDHFEGRTPHFESEYRMLHKNTTYCWMLCRGLAVRDTNGQVYRMVGSQTDITDRKVAEVQLLHDSFHDVLTGLANRALLLDRLEQSLHRAERYRDYVFAVLFLDLDHFKIVNDSLGHQSGDHLLIEFSRRLETCIRPIDTLARLGGDEFVIIVDQINIAGDALSIVNRIQQALIVPFILGGHEVFTTVSIGITMSTTGYQQPDDILRDADIAMYRAKGGGRARYELFDTSMHVSAMARLRSEKELRQAIAHQEFQIYYQPIVSLSEGTIVGVEALLRWQHPQHGLISPMEFIPLAEETGLIRPISEWLIRTACAQNKRWQDTGNSHLSLAINVSALEFKHPNLPQQIAQALQGTKMAAHALELEITETIAMDNIDFTLEILDQLSAMGLQISIDDFGTGHSSLGRLKHLPITTLKIDQSFIQDMTSNPDDKAITKAIIAMAESLNLQVIAEGVETEDQFSFLRSHQCDKAQGFLFSRPLPPEELTKLLQNGRDILPHPLPHAIESLFTP